MNSKVIKKHCNAVEMVINVLDSEGKEIFIKSIDEQHAQSTLSDDVIDDVYQMYHAGYLTLTYVRNIYNMLGYEIEVTPLVEVKKDECYRLGTYRWAVARYNENNRKTLLKYSNEAFNTYEEALENALLFSFNIELTINNKKQNNMKTNQNTQQSTSGNRVDDFVQNLKEGLDDVKQCFNESFDNAKDLLNDFNNSETKKEMQAAAKEVKDATTTAVKKGVKFSKAMFNAGKAFINSMKD